MFVVGEFAGFKLDGSIKIGEGYLRHTFILASGGASEGAFYRCIRL